MESGKVQKSEYLVFTRESGQEITVVDPRNREIDEAEVSYKCKRKNTSSLKHITYLEFHSLSLTPFYVRNSFSLSILFFFLFFLAFTISFRFLLYTCRTVMRASKYMRSKENTMKHDSIHERISSFFGAHEATSLSSKIKYYTFLYRGGKKNDTSVD